MPDKIALVTGSSSGLGLLTCVEFAKAGYHAAATMRDPGCQTKWRRLLTRAFRLGSMSAHSTPRTSHIASVVDTVARDYGHIDVLINKASHVVEM